jgi:hypothetical protein
MGILLSPTKTFRFLTAKSVSFKCNVEVADGNIAVTDRKIPQTKVNIFVPNSNIEIAPCMFLIRHSKNAAPNRGERYLQQTNPNRFLKPVRVEVAYSIYGL